MDPVELRAVGVLCVEFGAKLCQAADAEESGDEACFREALRSALPLVEALFRVAGLEDLGERAVSSIARAEGVGEALSAEQVEALYQAQEAKRS